MYFKTYTPLDLHECDWLSSEPALPVNLLLHRPLVHVWVAVYHVVLNKIHNKDIFNTFFYYQYINFL
jgi:hypothetical protein